jgi:hypothetical protein
MGNAPAFASATEAAQMARAALGFLAAADPTRLVTEEQAQCLHGRRAVRLPDGRFISRGGPVSPLPGPRCHRIPDSAPGRVRWRPGAVAVDLTRNSGTRERPERRWRCR